MANSVTLGFMLSVDELVFENLTSEDTKHIMGMVQGFNVHRPVETDDQSEEHLLDNYFRENVNRYTIESVIPYKLLLVLVLTGGFMAEYYYKHCKVDGDGVFVPGDLYEPSSVSYSIWRFFSLVPKEEKGTPVWRMPSLSAVNRTES